MRNRLATSCVLLLAFLSSGCTLWRERPVSGWSDATGGEGLEVAFWKDVKAKNWKELERHMSSTYVAYTPQEGRMDRADMLQHLQQLQLDDYSLGEMHTDLNGNTFVVTYTITLHGTLAGQPLSGTPLRVLTVWQLQKRSWEAIAHSVIGPAGK